MTDDRIDVFHDADDVEACYEVDRASIRPLLASGEIDGYIQTVCGPPFIKLKYVLTDRGRDLLAIV